MRWTIVGFAACAALVRAEAPPPDYGPGFEKLIGLGLPPLGPDAVWSTSRDAGGSSYQFRELSRSLKGNSWSVPAADGKFRLLPIATPAFLEEIQPKAPKPADLAKDVEQIIDGLGKIEAEAGNRSPFDSSSGFPAGSLLLFAAQIHQSGRKDLANQLAIAAFRASPNREMAVDGAVSLIAEGFYQKAAASFFETGDWAAFHRSLEDLVKRFPRGWHDREAVGLMLPQLSKQAAGEKPATPFLKDVELDPQVLALALQLMDKPAEKPSDKDKSGTSPQELAMMEYQQRERGFALSPLWVLGSRSSKDDEDGPVQGSPFDALIKRRMAAIPVLAALVGDPVFTHLPNSSSSYYSSSNESEEERILRSYQRLARPLSRGEIAAKLLAATLPDPENNLSEGDATTLRDLALTFWKDHKGDSDSQLAAFFLAEGGENQTAIAGRILATSTNPEDQKLFESHMLASENAIEGFQTVTIYLRARKSAAKPFYEAYAKLVRSQKTEGDDENYSRYSWMIREAGGVDKVLKQMEGLVGGQSPKAFAVQIAKGNPKDAEEGIKALRSMVADLSPTKRLYALLEGANAAEDAGVRGRFLQEITKCYYGRGYGGEPVESGPDRKLVDAEVAVWRKLVADERKIPEELNKQIRDSEFKSISDLAVAALEYSASPNCRFQVYQAINNLEKTEPEILRARAQARLAGQTVPAFPDPSHVPADRLKTIVAEAGAKSAAEIHPYLKSLSPDERAAWLKWLSEPEDLVVPESVKNLRLLVIRRAKESYHELPLLDDLGPLDAGFVVSVENVKNYIESLGKEVGKHSREIIHISNMGFGPGLEVHGVRFPEAKKPEPKPDEENESPYSESDSDAADALSSTISAFEGNDSADGVLLLEISSENEDGGTFIWFVRDGVAKPAAAEDAPKFEESLRQALAWDGGEFELSIQILGKADALKFKEQDSSGIPEDVPPP